MFDRDSLKVLHSYLSNSYQRTSINKSFSSWSKIVFGLPQGSVLGPLLFNNYINDLFYMAELTDVCIFEDDTTFHACLVVEWFDCNYMKLNQDYCHLIISGHKSQAIWAKIGRTKIWESKKTEAIRSYN